MAKDVEPFLSVSQPFEISIENSLSSSVPHFPNWIVGLLKSSFLSSLYILDVSLLSDVELMKISPNL